MRREFSDEVVNKNPRASANWISALTFWYTFKVFNIGRKRDLDEDDLTEPLTEHKSSVLGDKISRLWSKEVESAKARDRVPSMGRVLLRCFIWDILIYGFVLIVMEIFIRMTQPLFLGVLLRYFNPNNSENKQPLKSPMYLWRLWYFWTPGQCAIQTSEAYVFAAGIFITSMTSVLIAHPYMLAVMHIGMKVRIACCSLIYRKALRVSLSTMGGRTVGNVVNLMSNDVNRFDVALVFLHYLWLSPLQVLCIMYFLYKEIGISAVIGLMAIFMFIPLQVFFGRITSVYREKTALRTDNRVRQMNEIIAGIQVIKMYTWEYAFSDLVFKLRTDEIGALKYTSYIKGMIMSFIMFTTRFATFLTILTFILFGNVVTIEQLFVIIAYYQILRQTMSVYFPQGVAQIAEARVAIRRIRKFMTSEETDVGDPTPINPNWREKAGSLSKKEEIKKRPSLVSTSISATRRVSLEEEEETYVIIKDASAKYGDTVCLSNINLDLEVAKLTAVIGQVGAGKTCLLNLILGELLPFEGTVRVKGVVAYAAQEPWLFAGSVRQNILFGRPYDKARYKKVVRVCALIRDFTLLPYGDETIVGERGISLSGGQRARVNLARAVYRNADIYLLDDPLSAVDSQVGKQMFDECINGYLQNKIVILITHQLQYLRHVDQIAIMGDGEILARGSFDELASTGLDFAKVLEEQLCVDEDEQVTEEEGEVTIDEDLLDVQSIIKHLSKKNALSAIVVDPEGERYKPREVAEMRTTGAVSVNIYKDYFRAGGSWCRIISVLMMFVLAQLLASGSDFFIMKWVNLESERAVNGTVKNSGIWENFSDQELQIIYAVLISSIIIVAVSRSFMFYILCLRSSVNLHNRMFNSICKAAMRFFNTNTSGRILNRFSKDMGAIDEFLPNAMIDFTQILLNLVGCIAVVGIVNLYLLIPTFIMCTFFYLIRRFYLRTGRSVKRLEGITRSPVFSHLNATLQGLPTIRSNTAEMILVSEFDKYQDVHSSAWFMFISTSRAFGFWLDLICSIYIGLVTFSFLVSEASHGGHAGLAITQCIGLTGMFQWGMRQSAEMENQMTSVERVLEFLQVEHESDLESTPDKKPPPIWPTEGRIEFQDATMRYSTQESPVLKSLNFVIMPQEKIGIVGRTGAGKSSLIAALFRLAYFEGKIIIDDVDIGQIGLHDLRKKISIIPQEPVIFSGTMRYNLDPFEEYRDEVLAAALVDVEIRSSFVQALDCLDDLMTEGGMNLSVGQRQLLCLARAIVRNNYILVMDEATANVDPETDHLIQRTIAQKFEHCTVLTIAHRLHTVMDSDRVLVMDAGSVVELDHPHVLLQKKKGILTGMVDRTGAGMAENLKKIARENYQKRQGNKK